MTDMSYDYDKPQRNVCECGDTECLGDAAGFAQASADIAILLKLAKERNEARNAAGKAKAYKRVLKEANAQLKRERNEARELVKRMHASVNVDSVGEEYYSAMLEAHRAMIAWKGGAK